MRLPNSKNSGQSQFKKFMKPPSGQGTIGTYKVAGSANNSNGFRASGQRFGQKSNGFHNRAGQKADSNKQDLSSQYPSNTFENLGKVGASKNDDEVKVEKALIEMSEVRNDLIIAKNEEDKMISKSDSKSNLGCVQATSSNFKSSQNFFNATQNQTSMSGFFKDGGRMLGEIDALSPAQLRERLIVAETLMKQLYNRNKDVELYHKEKMDKQQEKSKKRVASASPQKGAAAQAKSPDPNTNPLDVMSNESTEQRDFSADIDMIQEFKQREEQMQ